MEIRFQNGGPEHWQADLLLALGCEDEDLLVQNPELAKACPWLKESTGLNDFKATKGEQCLLYGPGADLPIARVLLLGMGKREEVDLAALRLSLAQGLQRCAKLGLKSALLMESLLARFGGGRERLLEEAVCAAKLSLYEFCVLKTKADEPEGPQWLALGQESTESQEAALLAVRRGEHSASVVSLARDLANMPGNLLYPATLADRARDLAQSHGLGLEILDEKALEAEGLFCLLGVGQGSAHPPRLIILEYAPKGHEAEKPLIFIGKGITFDSGGICLKPAANMHEMKCDMSGASAVLAALCSLADEAVPRRIIGILPCAENLPDGRAFRPGDVLTCASGETVEVINTDAEGRLALCDALAYAQKRWTPQAIIDIATLTGACAVALGKGLAGLFCANAGLAERIEAAGAVCGENFWTLPLWQPYAEQLKSEVADIRHTGSREGGAITAALFLEHFLKPGALWAHLDIAGVDWNSKATALCPEGASGFGARTLLEFGRMGLGQN